VVTKLPLRLVSSERGVGGAGHQLTMEPHKQGFMWGAKASVSRFERRRGCAACEGGRG